MENVIILCQAFHHLEKSILLKEKVLKDSLIFNFHQNPEKLLSIKKSFNQEFIKHFETPEKIDFDTMKNISAFVFFSFSPHLSFIKFVHQIKKANKKIVFFQDNHQFSIHQGTVNSMIFEPDLIVAACENEKKYLIDNQLHSKSPIVSEGWLFMNISEKLKITKNTQKEKKILIIFTAPIEITLGSSETQASRKDIILWINKNFPDHQIIVKLHPHEDPNNLKSKINELGFSILILSSQSSINEAIESAEIIVSSNESQAPLDVISQDINKRLILYFYQKKNFLKDQSSIFDTLIHLDDIKIQIGEIEYLNKRDIHTLYLDHTENAYEEVKKQILKITSDDKSYDPNSLLEIYLWLYIYGDKKPILEFLENKQLKKYKNLQSLLLNQDFDLLQLKNNFAKNTSRDPLSIILVRYYLHKCNIDKDDLDCIVRYFFKESLFQYFFRDLMRFSNLVSYRISNKYFEPNFKKIILNIEHMYFIKFKYSIIFFVSLKRLYKLKIFVVSALTFYVSDRILRI